MDTDTRPVRVGDTMRRPAHRRSAYVDALLNHLAATGFTGAPRALGYDEQGRQVLSFIEGEVPAGEGPALMPDGRLVSAAALIRAFHDATVSFPLLTGGEVVAHSDLGPHNTVFRGDRAVAIIDFDEDLGPGGRLDDFAQAVWGFADLTDPVVPVAEQARKAALMCDVYGGVTPAEIVASLTARFRRARDQHRAAGLTAAAESFEELLAWMDRSGERIARG